MKTISIFSAVLVLFTNVSAQAVTDPEEACGVYKPLVVQITTNFDSGNVEHGFGFIVGEDGDGDKSNFYIVTAKHVVRDLKATKEIGKTRLRFHWDQGGTPTEAEVLHVIDTDYDIALLRMQKSKIYNATDKINWANMYWCNKWKKNETACFVGRGEDWYLPPKMDVIRHYEKNVEYIEFDSNKVQPGTSGAPLIIQQDGIIGMLIQDQHDGARAVNIERILDLIVKKYPDVLKLNKCGDNQEVSKIDQKTGMTDQTTGMEFVSIPKGCFQMGSPSNEEGGDTDEAPLHNVCVDGFFMGKYEVTQREWQKIMGSNPASFKTGGNYPVEQVSWDDAQKFITEFNKKSGKNYRLPTEAEWEYACRANRQGKYCGGDNLDDIAWYDRNSNNHTNPIGRKQANAFGLHDMNGNVAEWCSDWYESEYYSSSPKDNPSGPLGGSMRVFRGGAWVFPYSDVRAAVRGKDNPKHINNLIGFRVALPAK